MNLVKVRRKVGLELDSVLNSDFVLSVKKEPVLPMENEDRTEWLLWCCFVNNCTMQEANHRYKHNVEMMKKMAENIKNRRKAKGKKKKGKKKRFS